MRTMRNRRVGQSLGAAALVILLAACGGGEDATDTTDGSGSQAAEQPQTEETGDSGESGSGELEELTAEEFFDTTLAAQQEAGTMGFEVTSEANGTTTTVTGEAAYDGEQANSRTVDAEGNESLLVDGVFYMQNPALDPSGRFVKVDPNDEANSGFMALLGNLSTSPADILEAMGTPTALEVVGEEEAAGVPTLHYLVTVDGQQFFTNMGGMFEQMAGSVPKELKMDVWLDSDNRIRQQAQDLDLEVMGQSVTSHTETVITEYGQDVTIEAPPASEISDKSLADMSSGGAAQG